MGLVADFEQETIARDFLATNIDENPRKLLDDLVNVASPTASAF